MNFKAHLFICTHSRENAESCGPKGSAHLKDTVKKLCKRPGVRINASGCLGQCENGIAAVLYPQAQWFTDLKSDQTSIDVLKKTVDEVSPDA